MQGALGAPQDFHLLHIKQGTRAPQAAEINAVYDQADGGIERFLELAALAHAPDLEKPRAGSPPGEVDVGGEVHDALEVLGLALPDIPGVDDADTADLAQQGSGPQFSRDDDFLQFCRICQARARQAAQGGQGLYGGVLHARASTD